ncbi:MULTISPECIES: hypothetical protein [unclassified Novosphingobium]|uniref:hypothetical protein n=2 Tax=unclassified Novosphingobium TaxID=2644732 RepID=UPI0014941569|nr:MULTISPECIES: hypothetical protein [unclassified Novosphingobium]MBB3373394.1 hypothetical protein [Novosphingobium sp. BK280]MBB3377763.1 hypothetical protein [Novosphingobium sp. BK258]MBB3418826.1 hypothetical protein [Novosphingobium sp. BK267]MBB3476679.1 hypothetical protein [Novosphingobium sp. BK369]MBB3450339.1 hypothetical protein [Novosphingobium sp. BK352]
MMKFPSLALSSLLALTSAHAAIPQVYTPKPGSAERTAILKVLHDGDTRPEARFIIHKFRVVRDGSRSIAYVDGEGETGDFHAILTQQPPAPWRKVWGESDGGSDTCAAGAQHYAWAVHLIQSYKVAPDALFPGVVRQAQDLKRRAATEPDLQCVGDLDGGPGS